MADYIRLTEPPHWCIQYPTCSACGTDLETDGDGWTCPSCGTQWPQTANDGDKGELYAAWSGEEPTGPVVANDEAWRWGDYQERTENHRRWPDLFPAPKAPEPREDGGK